MDIEETVKIMLKGCDSNTDKSEIIKKLEKVKEEGRPLRIKLGLDPSAPDIHLGHAVVLRKIKQLQDLGNEAIIIIGDFTGMIGDPTGKSKTRKQLSREEVEKNSKTYQEQIFKVIDPKKTTVKYNSEWLGEMNFRDVINLASKCTVARMLERDDFKKRYESGQPISVHEFFYPLMQAYDSVAIKADIELGGTDQTFNLLVGRELQKDYGQEPQTVLTFPLLVGLDGKEKMSKSLDNYIGIDEAPETMYEKAMKIPDDVLMDYYRLTTDLDLEYVQKIINDNIVEAHKKYAEEIIKMYHGEEYIKQAQERYAAVSKGGIPENIKEIKIEEKEINIVDLLVKIGFAPSKSEAKRMVQGKGVKLNSEVVEDISKIINISENPIIQFGKNKFAKII